MPLFRCEQCGCVENTALSDYWHREERGDDKRALCSGCGPEGTWHGEFPQESADGRDSDPGGFLGPRGGGQWK